jgi:hypothetical protein
MSKWTQRALNRKALETAAALIEVEDFDSFFGCDLADELDAQDGGNEMMAVAHQYAVNRIRSLVSKGKP